MVDSISLEICKTVKQNRLKICSQHFETSGDSDVAQNADIEDVHAYWG
jgi:hypothetical protein